MWSNTSPGVIQNRAAVGARLQAARAAQMGGAVPPQSPPMPPPSAPPPPGAMQGPPGMPPGGMAPPMRPAGPPPGPQIAGAAPPAPPPNFKAQIAHGLAQVGHPVTLQHVHAAIDDMHRVGKLSAPQASALKQHNGPLMGPAGANTMSHIAAHLLKGKM